MAVAVKMRFVDRYVDQLSDRFVSRSWEAA